MKRPSFFPVKAALEPASGHATAPGSQYTQLALLPDDDIVVDGIAGQFIKWHHEGRGRWLVMRTERPVPALAPHAHGPRHLPLYRLPATPSLDVRLRWVHLPSFEQLARCDWGTHVTVLGQPARFNQAGIIDGRQVVVVLTWGTNPLLKACARRCEQVGPTETACYMDYADTGLRIGTAPGTPLLPDQIRCGLRRGDHVLVCGLPATYLAARERDGLWLKLDTDPRHAARLREAGAQLVTEGADGAEWRIRWRWGLQMRLLSASLPTFTQLRRMPVGTRITLGRDGTRATLQGTNVEDGTRQFVLTLPEPRPVQNGLLLMNRTRFQHAGLRLAG